LIKLENNLETRKRDRHGEYRKKRTEKLGLGEMPMMNCFVCFLLSDQAVTFFGEVSKAVGEVEYG
jgi:hypothetical protein